MFHPGRNDQRFASQDQQTYGLAHPPDEPTPAELEIDCKHTVICNINHIVEVLRAEGLD